MRLIDLLEESRNDWAELALQEDAFKTITSKDLSELLQHRNQDDCVKFMYSVLQSYIKEDLPKNYKLVHNKDRAQHCIVTYLMGIAINKRLKILKEDRLKSMLWVQASASHDYGYLSDRINNSDLELTDLNLKYNLFTDDYKEDFLIKLNDIKKRKKNFFTYTNDELMNYFQYSKFYHKKIEKRVAPTKEQCDHGIVGACLIFDKYCRQTSKEKEKGLEPNEEITDVQKIAAYNIASHNVFKNSQTYSQWKKIDKKLDELHLQKLKSDSNFRIEKKNELLTLLSLVDTIECYKIYQREGERSYVNLVKLLNCIEVNFNINKRTMIFDINPYINYVKDNKRRSEEDKNAIVEITKKHFENICKLNNWTELVGKRIDDFSVEISLEK